MTSAQHARVVCRSTPYHTLLNTDMTYLIVFGYWMKYIMTEKSKENVRRSRYKPVWQSEFACLFFQQSIITLLDTYISPDNFFVKYWCVLSVVYMFETRIFHLKSGCVLSIGGALSMGIYGNKRRAHSHKITN